MRGAAEAETVATTKAALATTQFFEVGKIHSKLSKRR
jgi:hypothetical protein